MLSPPNFNTRLLFSGITTRSFTDEKQLSAAKRERHVAHLTITPD
jgi:hypothetical protein